MIVLGIDPGTATTGYGLVQEAENGPELVAYGVILTAAGSPMPDRLVTIYQALKDLIAKYSPATGAVEKLFFQKNVSTAMTVGQARGVAILAMAQAGLSIGEYNPRDVKTAVAGYGGADKKQMQGMVKAVLNLVDIPKPDDAADALAVAICHLHSARLQALTG